MIKHFPIFDTKKVINLYTEKDGVPIKYVCTSAVQQHAEFAADVFYRETPHPEFGNRYFALYRNVFADNASIMITNADRIEDFDFVMIRDFNGDYFYSQHRHDYVAMGNSMIDGGRSYVRFSGRTYNYKVKDGEFVEVTMEREKNRPMTDEERGRAAERFEKNKGE